MHKDESTIYQFTAVIRTSHTVSQWSILIYGSKGQVLTLLLLLAHQSRRLEWAIVIAHRPSSVRPSVVHRPSLRRKLSHFRLLLWNRWTEFNETWQEARSHCPLPSLCFSGRSEKQDGRPGLWLAETFSTSPLKPLNRNQRILTGSKISMSSTKFVFFGPIGKTRWPPLPLIGWDIFHFSSETAERKSTKLDRKQDFNVLYQVCVFRANRKNKMAALASDWLRHFRLLLWNRWTGNQQNLTGSKISTSSTKFVFFRPIGKPRWPPWPLIGWDIFDFSSETAERKLKLDRKQDLNVLYQVCVFRADPKNKMAAPASDWLRHFRLLLWNCWKGIQRNMTGSKISMSSTKFVYFGLIGKTRWPPWPLIGWDIFDFSEVSLSLRKKSRHRHVGLQVWQLITRSQFDDWRHIVHHWKGNFHSFETIFPQDQKSIYAPAKYDLFNCSFIKPKQRYLADFRPRYNNK